MNPLSRPDISDMVASIRHDLEELRSTQLIGWDSFKTYRVSSNDQYDISLSLAPGADHGYDITFTNQVATAGAMVDLSPFFRVDNPDVMGFPAPRPVLSNNDLAIWWKKSSSTDTATVWRLVMQNRSTTTSHTGYVKLFFEGTDTGSFIIV